MKAVQWFYSRPSDIACGCCNLKMKVQKRTFSKFTVLIGLLVLFYVYYFRVVFKQFTEQLTNTAKFEEKNVMLCTPNYLSQQIGTGKICKMQDILS